MTRSVSFETVLEASIQSAGVTDDFALFTDNRSLWRKEKGGDLEEFVWEGAGETWDWYGSVCEAGDELVIKVGWYPREAEAREAEAPRGAFRAGPEYRGLLVVGPRTTRRIGQFAVTSAHPRIGRQLPGEHPDTIVPDIQSCRWNGRTLLVGAHGLIARLNLTDATAELLDYDHELTFNRQAIFEEDKALWVSEDEGGMSGGCVVRLLEAESDDFCLLGFNNADLGTDAIFSFDGRLMTGSAAGLVEIRQGGYTHFQLHDERARMHVFGARVAQGAIWGIRDDGWVRIDPGAGAATHFLLEGGVSNDVYVLTFFEDRWHVATDEMLVAVSAEDMR